MMGPMSLSEKITVAALGAATTYVAHRAVHGAWTGLTGEAPPNPHDPEVSTVEAVTWAVASGIGLALVQLLVSRYAQTHYHAKAKKVQLTL